MKRAALAVVVVIAAIGAVLWWTTLRDRAPAEEAEADTGLVAVEAASVTTGAVSQLRTFTGTLEAGDAFTVAPKTGGQVERVHVDIGDRVEPNQVLVELDDAEATQDVAEAEAELAVARAELEQARADSRLAQREFERTQALAERDLTSQSELDTARAEAEAQRTAISVATARVTQREAALERARVLLGDTTIRAAWPGDDRPRVVGERMVNAGDTVGANTPLLTVLRITPIKAVVSVPEADYAPLAVGQGAVVSADAFPGRRFEGRVGRIAPRFASDSRQARVEIRIPNADRALKPGMFATVRITLDRAEEVTLVPREALVESGNRSGVYLVDGGSPARVRFQPIVAGIRGDRRIEVREPADLSGQVVTLGQQMLQDGSPVIVSELPAS